MTVRPLRVGVVREEFMALTGNVSQALVLNQLLYWTRRCHDFDEMLQEENHRRQRGGVEAVNMVPFHGWIRKSLETLGQETMISGSKETMRRILGALGKQGWVESRTNPKVPWDRTTHYRVCLSQVAKDLKKHGYCLPGFSLEETPLLEEISPQPFEPSDVSSLSQNGDRHVSSLEGPCPEMRHPKDKDSLKTQERQSSKTAPVSKESLSPCETHSFGKGISGSSESDVPAQMIDIWNQTVEGVNGLVQVRHRAPLLVDFLKKFCQNDLSCFKEYCQKITTSRFLMGDLDKPNPWRMTLDAALEEEKAVKVFESTYTFGDREPRPRFAPKKSVVAVEREDFKIRQAKARIQRVSVSKEEADFREALYSILGDADYHIWVSKTGIQITSDSLVLVAPSDSSRDILSTRFYEAIKASALKVYGLKEVRIMDSFSERDVA